jgi:hypothetical protein
MGSVRQALEELPGQLRLGRGGIRLFVQFRDGKLAAPVKVAVFRIPGKAADEITLTRRRDLNLQQLEWIAGELGLDEGDTELVVEYADRGEGPQLHWIDFSWDDFSDRI